MDNDRKYLEREARKELILQGALNVFCKNGLEGTTMDYIAEDSGFGKATLYYYFHSKEEVFSAILENGWLSLWESLEPIINSNNKPRQTFIDVLFQITKNVRKHPGLYEFLFNVPKSISFENEPWKKYQERMYIAIHSLLEDGIKIGEFPKIDSKLLFKAMGGLFMGLVLMGNKEKPVSEQDVEELLNQLIRDPQHK